MIIAKEQRYPMTSDSSGCTRADASERATEAADPLRSPKAARRTNRAQAVAGGESSTTALAESTEAAQFEAAA